MSGLQSRNDSFQFREQAECLKRLFISDGAVLHPTRVMPGGMLGTDPGIVKASGAGMHRGCLPILVLQDVTA